MLRKVNCPSGDLQNAVYILLLSISEVDEKLEISLKAHKGKFWEVFVEYSSNPGQVIQNIRKIPSLIRKSCFSQSKGYLETASKIQNLFNKIASLEICQELSDLISEMISFFKIIEKTPFLKINRLKRIVLNSSSHTSRSGTPATCRITSRKQVRHVRSASKDFVPKKNSSEQDKRVQFLQESRYHKRLIEKLGNLIGEKMKLDPDYLAELKGKDFSKYVQFKTEYIEIHKDFWAEEAIKSLEESDLRISEDENLRFADVKKEAFFSFVCNKDLLSSFVSKVKTSILTAVNNNR